MLEPERYELRERPAYRLAVNRRQFLEAAGAGLLIAVAPGTSQAQMGGAEGPLEARLHIGEDGFITVLSGKIEEGQGALTELAMAAAEELRVPLERVRMVMADTDVTPNDGVTAGSGTTPRTVPLVRKAGAAARELLLNAASRQLGVEAARLEVRDGAVVSGGKTYGYADLARSPELAAAYKAALPQGTAVAAAKDWQLLGKPRVRLDARDIVTGAHRYPRDIVRPNMLYGKVLRPPAYGATLANADLSAARKMPGVTAVRDGAFVGCAAPTSFRRAQGAGGHRGRRAMERHSAAFERKPLRISQAARQAGDASSPRRAGRWRARWASAKRRLKATYQVAYAQHAPMEPRSAVAEWQDGRLTVWTGTSNPPGARQQLAEALQACRPTACASSCRISAEVSAASTPPKRPSKRPSWRAKPAGPWPCSGPAPKSSCGPTSAPPR